MPTSSSAADPGLSPSGGRLAGRKVLVTGAANGIGRATAIKFAQQGAQLALLDHAADALAGIGAELAMPVFPCDVGDPQQVEAAIGGAVAALGGLDGVVNAAGVLTSSLIEALDPGEWMRTLQVNLTGPLLIVQAALPALRQAGNATVVNIASVGGLKPTPARAAYSVSKAGLLMLGKCLALELGPTVRVNTVCPGAVETAMTERLLSDEAMRALLVSGNAMRRIGQPEDIAEALLYLTSRDSNYVNGATLVVDGGASWL